jgi:Na+-driven multidrug efflux pump
VLLNTPSDVLSDSSDYAGIILMGMLFVSLYNMCSNILRAVGDSKTPLVCLIAGVLSNVGLDLFYICVLGKGIKGAAYATVISQAISGFSSLFFLLKKYPEIIPKKDDWHIGSTLCKDMLLAGLSMGLMGCIVNIGSIILQQAINGFGTDILTAQTGARRLFDIMMVMVYTIGFSMTTYASQNMGAGRGDRVRQGVKHAIIIDTAITTVLIIFCFIFGERLMGWIASTDNPEIISNGTMYLKIGVVLFYVLGPLFILRCTLQGLGHRIMPLVSSGLELLTKIGFAGIFVPMLGYFGVAITEPVSWVIMIIPLIFSYASARKKI